LMQGRPCLMLGLGLMQGRPCLMLGNE
jgi:hypothetical protein